MHQILVVDDDPLTRITLTLMLEDANYQILTASDGAEALALLDRHAPDLVLSDIRLPHISGIQLLHKLRCGARHTDLPVLLMSASIKPDLANLTHCAFLEKPIDLDELLRVVATLVAHRQRSPQACISLPTTA